MKLYKIQFALFTMKVLIKTKLKMLKRRARRLIAMMKGVYYDLFN